MTANYLNCSKSTTNKQNNTPTMAFLVSLLNLVGIVFLAHA
jgi:hypothetical protein